MDTMRQRCSPRDEKMTQPGVRTSAAGVIDCYGLTDLGRVRERNEDQFLIADMRQPIAILHSIATPESELELQDMLRANLLLVADGVGGHAGGQKASQVAMEAVVEYLHGNPMLWSASEEDREEELRSALAWAQKRISDETERSPELALMGTTLTLAYLEWPTAYIAHCGDTRAYVYGGGELVQITRDQTIPQMLADLGVLDQRQVERHPLRNVLGSLLSRDVAQFVPCLYSRRLLPGDQLLLCSDGLSKHVTRDRIAQILERADHAADTCRELVVAANDAGGTDNITVVLAQFGHRIAAAAEDRRGGPVAGMIWPPQPEMSCFA
jgi:protein phosphatase